MFAVQGMQQVHRQTRASVTSGSCIGGSPAPRTVPNIQFLFLVFLYLVFCILYFVICIFIGAYIGSPLQVERDPLQILTKICSEWPLLQLILIDSTGGCTGSKSSRWQDAVGWCKHHQQQHQQSTSWSSSPPRIIIIKIFIFTHYHLAGRIFCTSSTTLCPSGTVCTECTVCTVCTVCTLCTTFQLFKRPHSKAAQ